MAKTPVEETTVAVDPAPAPQGHAGTDEFGLTSEVAQDDPVRTGIPRDETHDSLDRNTGTLSEEAVARRAEQAKE